MQNPDASGSGSQNKMPHMGGSWFLSRFWGCKSRIEGSAE